MCNFIQSAGVFVSDSSTIYTGCEKDAYDPHFFQKSRKKRFFATENCVLFI